MKNTSKTTGARYLFRLDDACPNFDLARWQALAAIFDQAGVKPLVAIIPDCQDPDFSRYPIDSQFWLRAVDWQTKGWAIGLHGCEHRFRTKRRGLVPFNAYSEFAGLPIGQQRQLIAKGYATLINRGLSPTVFVAPAHSFDRNTLYALAAETPINQISDGLAVTPFRRFDFWWIPQQLWRPRQMAGGLWTICLHPNSLSDSDLTRIANFIQTVGRAALPDWTSLPAPDRHYNLADKAWGAAFLATRQAKHWLRRIRHDRH